MTFYVYILGSKKRGRKKTYVGWTNNLIKRLQKHNSGKGAKSTKGRKWKIIYKKTQKFYFDWLKDLRDSAYIEIYTDKL